MLPIGDNFTMGPEDAVAAAEFLTGLTLPMHYNTFPPIKQDPRICLRAGGKGAQRSGARDRRDDYRVDVPQPDFKRNARRGPILISA